MGGTDDPTNLIELTVEEHAEAHRVLYEKYGKIEDYCAWNGLLGIIGKEEILKLIMKFIYEFIYEKLYIKINIFFYI